MKKLIPIFLVATVTGISSYYSGYYRAERAMYFEFVKSDAMNTILSTQSLYAIKKDKAEESIPWLEHSICSRLLVIGNSIDEFPEIQDSEEIRDYLSLAKRYSEDFDVAFCQGHEEIANRALILAASETTHKNFLQKYGKTTSVD
jgi:hypothetical protein